MEKLTLVTSFASLKAGDFVELRVCLGCHREHRMILTRLVIGRYDRKGEPMWYGEPECAGNRAIYADAVSQRRVYLIEIGFEASQSERATKKKRERA